MKSFDALFALFNPNPNPKTNPNPNPREGYGPGDLGGSGGQIGHRDDGRKRRRKKHLLIALLQTADRREAVSKEGRRERDRRRSWERRREEERGGERPLLTPLHIQLQAFFPLSAPSIRAPSQEGGFGGPSQGQGGGFIVGLRRASVVEDEDRGIRAKPRTQDPDLAGQSAH
ncbi:hypothetical protein EYF80_008841 [Liparis tanakae]|uniref:Uncharacterized protein n=1 Tax=Liparis tanakae TaxID=230148 RepID=A0A4Z2ISL1_9TELE|nr:hypothetical protein EYF80_008841 [Liparis tanakae]